MHLGWPCRGQVGGQHITAKYRSNMHIYIYIVHITNLYLQISGLQKHITNSGAYIYIYIYIMLINRQIRDAWMDG